MACQPCDPALCLICGSPDHNDSQCPYRTDYRTEDVDTVAFYEARGWNRQDAETLCGQKVQKNNRANASKDAPAEALSTPTDNS